MGKNKLQRFAETADFPNFIQKTFTDPSGEHELKGRWAIDFFRNNNPIVLEVGCGKGEYTTGLAKLNHGINFIGVDIKGARMWRGAKTAIEENISNAAFLRSQAGLLPCFFAPGEISGIWFTFPDPFHKKSKANKRLTSGRYLGIFSRFLAPGATIHLKTDNEPLFDYTLEVIEQNHHQLLYATRDVYGTERDNEASAFQTFYEKMFLARNMKILYLRFCLHNNDSHGQG